MINRAVRVFVSSTFKDMYEEREELIKVVFPELRRRCKERAVEFVDVDLRWGITDEQKLGGKILPVCLAEIERCKPFFIGMLGERYGWAPDTLDKELAQIQPWMLEHKDKSVTELEILHGVLRIPEMKELAYFYFRDLNKSKQIEDEISKKPNYQPEDEVKRLKLKALKEKIKNGGYKVQEGYPDAKALGNLILEDIWKVIDKKFPLEKVPTPLDRERMDHEAFALSRLNTYIGRAEYFKKLDEHINSENPPLVLLGESGSGKSALISNWVEKYKEKHPDDFMFLHFIGGTSDSVDHLRLLRRIMEEIKERYEPTDKKESESSLRSISGIDKENEIPTDPKKIVEVFPYWLAKASAKGKFILILDALNQIENKDKAPDLNWLPNYFPPNVRVILSTLPGRSFDALKKRSYGTMTVQPLDANERRILINDYLKRFGKSLSASHTEQIASTEQSANPLYLKTLLEELRIFGIHEELPKRITHYLTAKSVPDLFKLVLKRLEEDYEHEEKGLVRNAMTLIWASRRGLSETELLELLGSNGEPLPRIHWSPLYLALEESIVNRSNLLNFAHNFLQQAVKNKYLTDEKQKADAHLRIADYFDNKKLDDRKVDELPWQLQQAESWERLKNCVAEPEMFMKLTTETKKYELTGYWLSIGNKYDMVVTYNEMLHQYEQTSPTETALSYMLNQTAVFLDLNARYAGAEPLYKRALAINEKALDTEHPNTATSLNNLAELLCSKGDYAGAEPLYRRALAIREKVLGAKHPDTALSLNNLAGLLCRKGDYAGAEPLYRRALAIYEKSLGAEHPDTALSLNNLAGLLYKRGDYAGAEPLYRRALAIFEKAFGAEHPNTAVSLNNLALLLKSKGDYAGAEPLYKRALAIYEKSLGAEHPDTALSLNNLAGLLYKKGDYAGAESLYKRALAIREKSLGAEHPDTAQSLNNLAGLLVDKGDYVGAEPLYRKALAIREKVLSPEHPDTARTRRNLEMLLKKKNDTV